MTQSSNALHPCNNGDCSNWITFIDDTAAAMKNTGMTVTYEPYNEPNGSGLFPRSGISLPSHADRIIQETDSATEVRS